MGRSGLIFAVLWFAWATSSAGFKDADFKKCQDAAFCGRLRGVISANYSIDLESAKVTNNVATFNVVNEDDQVWFQFAISSVDGILRFFADETLQVGQRYQVADILMPNAFSVLSSLQLRKSLNSLTVISGSATVTIAPKPFKISVSVKDKLVFVFNDQQLFHMEHRREKKEGDPDGWWEEHFKSHKDAKPKGPQAISFDLEFPSFHHIYGIPERATSLSLQPTTGGEVSSEPYRLYNLDVFEYVDESPFGLYGSIPMVLAHRVGQTVGAFWLNAAEMYVDVEVVEGGLSTQWMSESGVLDLFLMLGPSPSDVMAQYAALTGPSAMPQLFAIGYHQCRWNYKDEEDVSRVDAGFDQHGIPYDVLWLDIEHTDGKRYMTWDSHYFPTPERMQLDLAARGRKMVTIIDPHVKRDPNYVIFKEAEDLGHYVKTHDNKDFDGWCWPGSSSYLDVVSPVVRHWWASQFSLSHYKGSTKYLYVWNDMNEPSVFNGPEITMHKDNLHYGQAEHRDVHNVYGLYYHLATAEGLKQRGFEEFGSDGDRPFVLSRAFFAGTQRVGPIWTGDNSADWRHLAKSIPMLLSIGLTGITFSGADVGGFFGNPDAQLMTRWYQLGAFYPFFRGHAHLETKRREPWLFGDDTTARIRAAIQMRYSLLPYMYTLFRHANMSGAPVMRPLWYEFPSEPATFAVDHEFMLGPALLIAPVLEQDATSRSVYLPQGSAWYDGHSGRVVEGEVAAVPVTLDSVPLFIRAGTIFARKERPRRSSVAMAHDPITLVVALDEGGAAAGELYVDDGSSFAFLRGQYVHKELTFAHRTLTSRPWGQRGDPSYDPQVVIGKIVVLGLPKGPSGWSAKNALTGAALSVTVGPLTWRQGFPDEALIVRNPALQVAADWSVQFTKT